jgi:SAM-dependent methyltransferase
MSRLGRLARLLPARPRRFVQRCRYALRVVASLRGTHPRSCPLCGYEGLFRAAGFPPEVDELCPRCGSLARHRLFHLMEGQHDILRGARSLLHFAPEAVLRDRFSARFTEYRTADLARADVDYRVDMQNTGLPENAFDAVFASHVLEHVGDDRAALAELARILRPAGVLVVMVPLVDAWDETYEDPGLRTEAERELHYGQGDHVRLYGLDLMVRLAECFEVTAYMASPAECAKHSLVRGERVFACRKPARQARR